MSTPKQIEANRNNARRSTGPRTDVGKSNSRLNATTHGLAGESEAVTDDVAEVFKARREAWAAEYRPEGQAAGWALDRLVVASIRIERCEEAVNAVIVEQMGVAQTAWGPIREAEVSEVAARLAQEPERVSRRLSATSQGVALMVGIWRRLVVALDTEGGWNESDLSRALDLIGVPRDLRRGWTMFDAPHGVDPNVHRRRLVFAEVDRLESLRAAALDPLDDLQRIHAEAGTLAILSKPAALVLRYERDAWRRFREAQRDLKNPPAPADPPVVDEIQTEAAPEPEPEPKSAPPSEPPPAPPEPPPVAAPARDLATDQVGLALAAYRARTTVTERTQFPDLDPGSPATERTQFVAQALE